MNGVGTWMGLLAAFFGMVTSVSVLLATFKVVIPLKRTADETHVIVNQQRTDMQNIIVYQKQVIDALRLEAEENDGKGQAQSA